MISIDKHFQTKGEIKFDNPNPNNASVTATQSNSSNPNLNFNPFLEMALNEVVVTSDKTTINIERKILDKKGVWVMVFPKIKKPTMATAE